MASKIEQFLNKILSSRYGKDVRQAIHDGIKQCYDDVTNPDLNTEAFETAVQNKIDDGSLALLTIPDRSITKEKLGQDITENIAGKVNTNQGTDNIGKIMMVDEEGDIVPQELSYSGNKIIETTYEKVYSDPPGYYGNYGSYKTRDIPINGFKKIHAESTTSRICWYGYKIDEKLTYVNDVWLSASMNKNKLGVYVFDLDLEDLIEKNAESICIGFYGQNFDNSAQKIIMYYDDSYKDIYVRNNIVTDENKLIDTLYYKNSGYSGDLFEMFGANKNWHKGGDGDGYIDVIDNKTLYIKCASTAFIPGIPPAFGCFGSDKKYLFKSTDDNSEVRCNRIAYISGKHSSGDSSPEYIGISDKGLNIASIFIYEVTFPDNVKYVAYIPNLTASIGSLLLTDSLFVAGRKIITD